MINSVTFRNSYDSTAAGYLKSTNRVFIHKHSLLICIDACFNYLTSASQWPCAHTEVAPQCVTSADDDFCPSLVWAGLTVVGKQPLQVGLPSCPLCVCVCCFSNTHMVKQRAVERKLQMQNDLEPKSNLFILFSLVSRTGVAAPHMKKEFQSVQSCEFVTR